MKKRQGFTIVELLVAVSIGIMVIVGGVVAGNKFNANQKIDSVSSEIIQNIKLAKNYAMTRQKPENYSNGSLSYVVVTLNGGNGQLEILGGNNIVGIDVINKYLSTKVNVTDTSVGSIASGVLVFSVPEGKLVDLRGNESIPSGVGGSVAIAVSSIETGGSKVIIVSETGAIK